MDKYTIGTVSKIFGVSRESIRRWSEVAQEFLSPEARAGHGNTRFFTVDDLAVIALVSEMRKHRASDQSIVASLAAGTRGDVPSPEEMAQGEANEQRYLMQIERLSNQLALVGAELERLHGIEAAAIRSETLLESERAQSAALKEELEGTRREVLRLERELAYLRGKLDVGEE